MGSYTTMTKKIRIKLYGTPFSLYTGKVRSYLLKRGLEFEEVLATLQVYKNFIVPRTGVAYVPVIQIFNDSTGKDMVIQDSTVIIDALEKLYPEQQQLHSSSVYPTTPKQKMASLLLEVYGDEWLVIPAMHYRWNFPQQNDAYIHKAFGSVVLPWSWTPDYLQRLAGRTVAARFKDMVPKLGITPQTIPAIEVSFTQLLNDLNVHFTEHDYLLGGTRPSIGDFGLIGPFYAHLYLDPAPGELMRRTAPKVCQWVERMTTSTDNDEDANPTVRVGSFLPNDQVPETLLPMLRRMAKEQLPVLLDTDQRLAEWRQSQRAKQGNDNVNAVKRVLGMHPFTVENTQGERAVLPFSLWMFQRPVKYYASLTSEKYKEAVDDMLQAAGFGRSIQDGLQNDLTKVDNITVFSDGNSIDGIGSPMPSSKL